MDIYVHVYHKSFTHQGLTLIHVWYTNAQWHSWAWRCYAQVFWAKLNPNLKLTGNHIVGVNNALCWAGKYIMAYNIRSRSCSMKPHKDHHCLFNICLRIFRQQNSGRCLFAGLDHWTFNFTRMHIEGTFHVGVAMLAGMCKGEAPLSFRLATQIRSLTLMPLRYSYMCLDLHWRWSARSDVGREIWLMCTC